MMSVNQEIILINQRGDAAFVRILKLSFVRILSSDFVRMGFYRVLTMSEWVFIEF